MPKKQQTQKVLHEVKFLGPVSAESGALRFVLGTDGVESIIFAGGQYTIIKSVKGKSGVAKETLRFTNIPAIETEIEVSV